MEHTEARRLLAAELETLRSRSYSELIEMIGDEDHPAFEVIGRDGQRYWLEVEAFWDETSTVRVRGAICGGGIDYQVPMMTFSRRPMGPLSVNSPPWMYRQLRMEHPAINDA